MLAGLWRLFSAGLIGGALCLQTAGAQNAPDANAARPKIGLVLAGGGAKGAAHIGVLQVLDELHVPVDCVVGTSMGALVGATFASGIPAPEIERSVLAIDWQRTVGGQGRRDRMPIKRKLSTMTYSNSLEVGLQHGSLRLPGGLIATQEIEQVIRTLVASARYTHDFDDLPIPFRAIATDMVAGEMVVLDGGDLAQAMRASMALPGVFSPVDIDGKVLSDGGLMRNLPVDIARKLCADVVIAVWMSSPPPTASDLTSSLSLMSRSVDVMIATNQREQIASLRPTDVGIEVPMGDIGTSDFQRVPEAVELGRKAAEMQRAALQRFAVSDDAYRAWLAKLHTAENETPVLADVKILGTQRVNPEYVRAQLEHVAAGKAVTAEDITADTERIYALGDFERVDYSLTGPADARVLEIQAVEKSWGPDFLRFDLGLSTYEGGDIFAILRLDHDRTWVNSLGGQWHNALQIGRQTIAQTDFYQPIDVRQRFFVQPLALAEDDYEDVYLDGDRVARYIMRQRYAQVDVGMNVGTRAQLRLGVRSASHEATVDTGMPALPELEHTPDATVQLRAVLDTRDSAALPTRGTFLNARYAHSEDWFGGQFDYSMFEALMAKAFSVRGGDSLAILVGGGETLSGQLPVTEQFEIGGIRTFPGLRPGELRGNSYWTAGTRYAWRLADIQPLFGQALYAGIRLQAAEMHERIDGVPGEVLYGLSGALGGSTPIGPFIFSLGWVSNHSYQLQFTLGRPVAEGTLLDELQ
jgi:NTE family protein